MPVVQGTGPKTLKCLPFSGRNADSHWLQRHRLWGAYAPAGTQASNTSALNTYPDSRTGKRVYDCIL